MLINFRKILWETQSEKKFYFRAGIIGKIDAYELKNLGIVRLLDLRSPIECKQHPLIDSERLIEHLHFYLDNTDHYLRKISNPSSDDYVKFYQYIYMNNSDVLLKIVNTLLNTEQSTLIACSAGKDRTGLVIMLLLFSLGVSDDEIVEDYQQSTAQLAKHLEMFEPYWLRKNLTKEQYSTRLIAHESTAREMLKYFKKSCPIFQEKLLTEKENQVIKGGHI